VKKAFGKPIYMNPIREEREEPPLPNGGIYVASRTRYADLWKTLRLAGAPIISSWIDASVRSLIDAEEEQHPGNVLSAEEYKLLWEWCIKEVKCADVLILFYHPSDQYVKGALVEVGAALACDIPVLYVGPFNHFSFTHHPLVHYFQTLEEAMQQALSCCAERKSLTMETMALQATTSRFEGTIHG
jgi:hypothetical protein